MTQKILHRLSLTAFFAYETTSYIHNFLFSYVFFPKHEFLTPLFAPAIPLMERALPYFPSILNSLIIFKIQVECHPI